MAKMAMPLDKASSLRDEAGTAMLAEKHDDLKKQSQFVPGEVDAKSFVTGDYDKTPAAGDEENKANRTCPEHVERSQIKTDTCLTEPVRREIAPASAGHLTALRASQ
jgi:hypothetical protein